MLRKAYYCIIAEQSDQLVTSISCEVSLPLLVGSQSVMLVPTAHLLPLQTSTSAFASSLPLTHLKSLPARICQLTPHSHPKPPSKLPSAADACQPVCLLSLTHAAQLCLGSLCANMATDYAGQRSSPASRGHRLTVPICRLFS